MLSFSKPFAKFIVPEHYTEAVRVLFLLKTVQNAKLINEAT
jgi:hypothetical protein